MVFIVTGFLLSREIFVLQGFSRANLNVYKITTSENWKLKEAVEMCVLQVCYKNSLYSI
jgi:hypothetical protein